MKPTFKAVTKAFVQYDNRILILQKANKEVWHLPGGAVEHNDTSIETACLRELEEETSLGIIDVRYLYSEIFSHKNKQYLRFQFEANTTTSKVTLSDEHSDYAWITLKEIDDYAFSIGEKERIQSYVKNK
ncbi:MAG: NUDIX hydrolase [Nanobdellota archaeon]